ncbi:MAG: flagellar hook-basal body protein [Ruminococcus sp.]|nr:flagellar hook-basal body protein [Ruminococcus sp.]
MYRGFYLAANGMINQQRIIDIISNNVANVNTAGYKSDTSINTTFEEKLILIREKNNKTGNIVYRTQEDTYADLSQGSFEYTGRRLDVAIRGNVFFNIQPYSQLYEDDGEVLLTRNGQFNIDNEGFLALGSAGRVLGDDGEPIPLGTADFAIAEDGTINTDDGRTYRLQLTYVDSAQDVEKKGDNMFVNLSGTNDIPADEDYLIIQGAYERSNVDITDQTIDVLAAQRIFEACSTAMSQIDTINQKAATELARI